MTQYPLGLSGIPVMYRICSQCQFIFTDFFDEFTSEQWQRYVYNDEYIKIDPEYVRIRPRDSARDIITFLNGKKNSILGLDYGGGNGMTAALLREHGWSFDSFDPFGHTDISPDLIGKYNFCSAIEVFEHTTNPLKSLRTIVEMTSSAQLMIMIRTEVHDNIVSKESRLSWWYAAPRNGHVSLYSSRSLQILAASVGLTYTTLRGPHLLTRGISESDARSMLIRGKLLRRWRSTMKLWRGSLA